MQQGMGITRAPVQRRQTMAQGGIVGYQDGGFLDRFKDEETGMYRLTLLPNFGMADLDRYVKEKMKKLNFNLGLFCTPQPTFHTKSFKILNSSSLATNHITLPNCRVLLFAHVVV